MIRWLAIVCLLAAPAGAQVFKPKTGSSGSTTTTTTTTTKSSKAKKASTKTASKKTSARKSKKKSAVASKGRPSDLTPDEAPKVDPDYVKIIDDDDE
jgi:hypothetical protein